MPRRVAWEKSRQQLSENVSFGVGTLFVRSSEALKVGPWGGAMTHGLRYLLDSLTRYVWL